MDVNKKWDIVEQVRLLDYTLRDEYALFVDRGTNFLLNRSLEGPVSNDEESDSEMNYATLQNVYEDRGSVLLFFLLASENIQMQSNRTINMFDMLVMITITTLLLENPTRRITPSMIYKKFNIKCNRSVRPEMQRKIANSMLKQECIKVAFDFRENDKVSKIIPPEFQKGSTRLLEYTTYDIEMGSDEHYYQFHEIPIMGMYAICTGQITKVRSDVLHIYEIDSDGNNLGEVKMDERRMLIKLALLFRIYKMQRGHNLSTHIPLKNLLTDIYGESDFSEKIVRSVREFCEISLRYWCKCELIRDYELIQRDKGKIVGFNVVLCKKDGVK